MTKDEYTKTLEKYMTDNDLEQEDGLTYLDGIQEAASLARQLDEPKKVVIPQYVADSIEEYRKDFTPLGIVYKIFKRGLENHWQNNQDNQKLLLNAIANGYEVEKEPKYYVKIKHFDSSDDALYVNHSNARGGFFLDNKIQSSSFHTIFTKSYLKDNWTGYEAYNNAGLLEFEEVEDD